MRTFVRVPVLFAALLFLLLSFEGVHGATYAQLDGLGMISVKEYGAVGDGVADDTAEIQAALDAGRAESKAVLFPQGTYLVSNTLKCYWPQQGDGGAANFRWNTPILIGSTRVAGQPGVIGRPVIKLKNSTFTGSVNISSPHTSGAKFVVDMAAFLDTNYNGVWDAGEEEKPGNAFFLNIRNVAFDLGTGNTAAVALRLRGAQGCTMEDILVYGSGSFFAGIHTLAGSHAINGNLEVIGGRVGIWGAGSSHATGVNAVKLTNQTEYAYYRTDGQSVTIAGFEITKAGAPAIGIYGSGPYAGDLALIDGVIEFTNSPNGAQAIQNPNGNGLYMHDVYVKNASELVKSGSRPSIPGGSGWKRITEYANPDMNATAPGYNVLNGAKETPSLEKSTISDCAEGDVPGDFIARHCWNRADFPSPDDIYDRIHTDGDTTCAIGTEAGMVKDNTEANSTDSTGPDNDNTAILQGLIDSGKKFILIPRGKFLMKKSAVGNYGIQLRANTILLGVNHNMSELRVHDDLWNPTSEVPLLTTVDSATAAPKVHGIKLGIVTYPLANDWFNYSNWKAGKNSMTRAVSSRSFGTQKVETNVRSGIVFSGNGGGRHFGFFGGGTPNSMDAYPYTTSSGGAGGYRRVKVINTSQPLAAYNSNPEDTHDRPQIEIVNSSNVILYGCKAEDRYGWGFTDSNNCAIIGAGGRAEVQFDNCTNSFAAIIAHKNKKDPFNTPTFYLIGGPAMPNNAPLGLYKTGTFNWAAVKMDGGSGDYTAPAAPQNLSAAADNPNYEIDLNWDDNSEPDLAGYHVYRSTVSGQVGSRITSAPLTVSSYSDDALEIRDGVRRYYTVSAVDNSDNESSLSSAANAILNDTLAPLVPQNLDAEPGDAQVTLTWDAVSASDFQDYQVYRSTVSGSYGAAVHTTTSTSWTDQTVTNGVTYYYKVTARDTIPNESAKSNEASATPNGGGGGNPVTLTFNPTDDAYVYEYQATTVYNDAYLRVRKSNSYRRYSFLKFNISGINGAITSAKLKVRAQSLATTLSVDCKAVSDTSWSETTLNWNNMPTQGTLLDTESVSTVGTWYEFDVMNHITGNANFSLALSTTNGTTNTDGFSSDESSDRPVLEVVYQPSGGDTTPPAAPSGLAATSGDEQIALDWNDNSEGDLAKYEVYRSTTSGGPYGLPIASPTSSDYTDAPLQNGVTLYYVVTAVDTSGNTSPASAEVSGTPADVTAPGAPTGLAAAAGDETVALDWNDNGDADLDGYFVYRSTDGTSYEVMNPEPLQISEYADDSAVNGTLYYYKVTAVDEVPNESGFSNTVSATPQDVTPPNAPTGLTATASGTQIQLDWSVNTDADLAAYRVYRGTVNGGPYPTLVSTVTFPTCLDADLAPGTYYYVVTAIDEVPLESGNSNQASATIVDPAPSQPTGLAAEAGNQQVDLDWNDNPESDLLNYDVWRSTSAGSDGSVVATVTTSDYTDTGLTNGTTYYYKVQARDVAQQLSTKSAQVSAAPTGGVTVYTFESYGANDGWVLESGETTNVGGTMDATASTTSAIRIGDSNTKKQYRSILDFDTGPMLPDDAVIQSAVLKIKRGTSSGNTSAFGAIYGDVRTFSFNSNPALEIEDFQATAYVDQAVTLSYPGSNGTWATGSLNTEGVAAISRTYRTQIKVRFATDDDNDSTNDYLGFYSGENATQGNRPILEVTVVNGGGDTTPPAVPTGLSASAGNGQVVLNWTDNTDGDLADYRVYRSTSAGGTYSVIATVTSSNFTDNTVTNGVTYYYKVTARDTAANESAQTAYVSAMPSAPAVFSFNSTDDSYVSNTSPTENYGSQSYLRVRGPGGPYEMEGYLKFSVSGLSGPVTSAVLKFTNQSGAAAYSLSAHAVSNTTWTEGALTWNNKPAMGSQLDNVSVTATETQYAMDVTNHITGNGTFSLGLDTASSTPWNIYIHSEESSTSAKRPVLEVTCGSVSGLHVEKGAVTGVSSSAWTPVTLTSAFESPVVVCTTNYTESGIPAVVRVRNAAGNRFDVQAQNPSGTSISGMTVQYMVVEEGVYDLGTDGVKMEAKKITSTVTDGYTNGWVGQTVTTGNSYSTPVVLGQVMTANDASWSQFWCCSEADRALPPSNGSFALGKHVGEDTDLTRSNETIGYIVIEAGTGTMDGLDFLAGRSDDFVRGMDNAPPFAVSLSGLASASNAIVTSNAMEGDNGGWAVGYGSSWFSSTNLNLACDEDQINDAERAHATEPVAYIVFE